MAWLVMTIRAIPIRMSGMNSQNRSGEGATWCPHCATAAEHAAKSMADIERGFDLHALRGRQAVSQYLLSPIEPRSSAE